MDISVDAQDATLGDSQVPFSAHLLVAIAPVGPLGHDTLTVLSVAVSSHSNTPRSLSVVSVLHLVLTTRGTYNLKIIHHFVTYHKYSCHYKVYNLMNRSDSTHQHHISHNQTVCKERERERERVTKEM